MSTKRIKKDFFLTDDVVQISKDLLGKVLVTRINGAITSGIITETEAYRGPDDKASHAYNNRFTKRTRVMYEEGGVAYIYLCYGIHHLFNVVTGSANQPHAVLIRAIKPLDGLAKMLKRRGFHEIRPQLSSGPGVMTMALGIHTGFTGEDLTRPDSRIWLEDHTIQITDENMISSPRVGVDYAEECTAWNWRFRIKNSIWTSKAK